MVKSVPSDMAVARVVKDLLPDPLTPTSIKCPLYKLRTLAILHICWIASLKKTKFNFVSSSI